MNEHSFSVAHDTPFFLPVGYIDDSPPVAGTFPRRHTQAIGYWYGRSGLGTKAVTVLIDGRATRLSHDYLIGPISTPVLSDGIGTHSVEEAAFLTALPAGTHTIELAYTWSGAFVPESFGTFLTFDLTFDVSVA